MEKKIILSLLFLVVPLFASTMCDNFCTQGTIPNRICEYNKAEGKFVDWPSSVITKEYPMLEDSLKQKYINKNKKSIELIEKRHLNLTEIGQKEPHFAEITDQFLDKSPLSPQKLILNYLPHKEDNKMRGIVYFLKNAAVTFRKNPKAPVGLEALFANSFFNLDLANKKSDPTFLLDEHFNSEDIREDLEWLVISLCSMEIEIDQFEILLFLITQLTIHDEAEEILRMMFNHIQKIKLTIIKAMYDEGLRDNQSINHLFNFLIDLQNNEKDIKVLKGQIYAFLTTLIQYLTIFKKEIIYLRMEIMTLLKKFERAPTEWDEEKKTIAVGHLIIANIGRIQSLSKFLDEVIQFFSLSKPVTYLIQYMVKIPGVTKAPNKQTGFLEAMVLKYLFGYIIDGAISDKTHICDDLKTAIARKELTIPEGDINGLCKVYEVTFANDSTELISTGIGVVHKIFSEISPNSALASHIESAEVVANFIGLLNKGKFKKYVSAIVVTVTNSTNTYVIYKGTIEKLIPTVLKKFNQLNITQFELETYNFDEVTELKFNLYPCRQEQSKIYDFLHGGPGAEHSMKKALALINLAITACEKATTLATRMATSNAMKLAIKLVTEVPLEKTKKTYQIISFGGLTTSIYNTLYHIKPVYISAFERTYIINTDGNFNATKFSSESIVSVKEAAKLLAENKKAQIIKPMDFINPFVIDEIQRKNVYDCFEIEYKQAITNLPKCQYNPDKATPKYNYVTTKDDLHIFAKLFIDNTDPPFGMDEALKSLWNWLSMVKTIKLIGEYDKIDEVTTSETIRKELKRQVTVTAQDLIPITVEGMSLPDYFFKADYSKVGHQAQLVVKENLGQMFEESKPKKSHLIDYMLLFCVIFSILLVLYIVGRRITLKKYK